MCQQPSTNPISLIWAGVDQETFHGRPQDTKLQYDAELTPCSVYCTDFSRFNSSNHNTTIFKHNCKNPLLYSEGQGAQCQATDLIIHRRLAWID